MSIEVKPGDQMAVPASSNGSAPNPSRLPLRPWRRRRYQLAAISAFVLLVGLVAANNYLARVYTPEGAVRQYLSALQSGDSSAAWSAIQVQAPGSPAAVSLVDESALKAALAAVRADLKAFSITGTTKVGNGDSSVGFSYETSAGTKQATLLVQRSTETHFAIYGGWQVLVAPTLLQLNLPTGGGGVKIDGRSVALPAGKSTIAVLPVAHRLDLLASQIFNAQSVPLNDLFLGGQVVLYKPTVSDAGLSEVKVAVKAAFAACAQQRVAYRDPDSTCPQSADASGVTGQWSVFGDPTQDLSVTFDGDLSAAAIGHYQMVFSYQKFNGMQRLPAGGAYSASASFKSFGTSKTQSSFSTAYNAYLFWDGQTLQLITVLAA